MREELGDGRVRQMVESRSNVELDCNEEETILLTELNKVLKTSGAIECLASGNAGELICDRRGEVRSKTKKKNFETPYPV